MKLKNWRGSNMTVVTIIEKNKDSSIASSQKNIQKIGEQLQESNKIKQEANDFNNRGFFGRLSGSITSRNDTDADDDCKTGGQSEYHTGSDQCLLQIQSEKNVVLKEFSSGVNNGIYDSRLEIQRHDTGSQ
jgi:hypothetical protein